MKELSCNKRSSLLVFILTVGVFGMVAVYIALFFFGQTTIAMGVILLAHGILAGIASNNCQYMITQAAPQAPDFANGLFLTSTNLGTAVGTAFCGMFITQFDTRYAVIGTFIFLVLGIVFVFLRQRNERNLKQAVLKNI